MPRRPKQQLNKVMVSSGRYVDPVNLQPEEVEFEVIAHHLSNLCRFTGGTRRFYSVAEHSVRVSLVLHGPTPEQVELSMCGLLHDAAEAYLTDLPRPVKHNSDIGKPYRPAEERADRAIAEAFGLAWPMPPEVTVADAQLLATERRDLLPPRDDDHLYHWLSEPPLRERIANPWQPEHAKWEFTRRYRYLERRRNELALTEAA